MKFFYTDMADEHAKALDIFFAKILGHSTLDFDVFVLGLLDLKGMHRSETDSFVFTTQSPRKKL